MKAPFKTRVWRVALFASLAFFVLFLFRFIYGYTTGASEASQEGYISDFFSDLENVKHNYASDSYRFRKFSEATAAAAPANAAAPETAAGEVNVSQKYEKTATIRTRTGNFEKDEQNLRNTLKRENAIIQYEQNAGRKGSRELHLIVGVAPEKFDSVYHQLIAIGNVRFKEITKIDKTNEYKNLNARKASLEITRQSLLDIKKHNGAIEEFVQLQNRILEIEQELQSLGVSLGEFDEENEFCTVRITLAESFEVKISMLHRVKVAFEWSVQFYLLMVCIAAASAFFAFFLLLIIDKMLPSIMNRVNQ